MRLKVAIFDCDGTMVDGQAMICRSMAMAFEGEGLVPPDHHIVRRIVGLSLIEAMRVLHPRGLEADHQALVERYKAGFRSLRERGLVEEPLYDGFTDLVERLSADGWLMAVATGKSDRGLTHCLQRHGIAAHFVSLQTADRHPVQAAPSMVETVLAETGVGRADAVVIGDTSYDMEMAANAGVRAIGVDWGYHPPEELITSGAVSVARSMEELYQMLTEGASA